VWVPHDVRDQVVDFVRRWSAEAEIPKEGVVRWMGVSPSKFFDWQARYGKVNEHNAWVPRDHWLEDWEEQAILGFYRAHPQEGYRRLAFMMLDADVVAVSPSSVYRVLSRSGLLMRWNRRVSKKGTGFVQPTKPHEHWHVDVAYLNLGGTFFYLCSVLDGFCRAIVHWEVKASMTEWEVELVLQRAREKCPHEHPRIISDNGPQFIARDFKEFIREVGLTHVRISPGYPQSNGKLERYHRTLKEEGIRPRAPRTEEEANTVVEQFVRYYNEVRLHSAIGYITPAGKLAGRAEEIFAARDRKLEAARRRRAENRQPACRQARRRRAQKTLEVAAATTLVA